MKPGKLRDKVPFVTLFATKREYKFASVSELFNQIRSAVGKFQVHMRKITSSIRSNELNFDIILRKIGSPTDKAMI
jgi:hypothetical protein